MRSTIKWGGAVLTVLLLIVWVGSKWYLGFWFFDSNNSIAPTVVVVGGQIWLGSSTPVLQKGSWDFNVHRWPFQWWFESHRSSSYKYWCIPIWFPALFTAIPTFLMWRTTLVKWHHDRKRDPSACPNCGYSRTGLPDDRACPECGGARQSRDAS